ncbi:putative dihydroxyacetone kinase (DakA), partial [Corchorus capsularis]
TCAKVGLARSKLKGVPAVPAKSVNEAGSPSSIKPFSSSVRMKTVSIMQSDKSVNMKSDNMKSNKSINIKSKKGILKGILKSVFKGMKKSI